MISRIAGSVVLSFSIVGAAQWLHGALGPEHMLVETVLTIPVAFVALAVGSRAGHFKVPVTAAAMTAALIPAAVVHGAARTGSHHGEQIAHATTDALTVLPVTVVGAALALLVGRRRVSFVSRASLVRHRRPIGLSMTLLAMFTMIGNVPMAGATHTAFTTPLTIPPVLTDENITIDMEEADVPVLAGAPTKMWTYNGTFPGPTIRRPSGTPTRVTFNNNLPESVGSTTVHHHGNHSAASEDGPPHAELIPTGGSRTYTYEFMEDGAPERGAFQWYHDHRMDVTGRNVWMGLAGMVILDDPAEAELNAELPKDEFDVPLMLADRSFGPGNQLSYEFNPNGVQGTHILVNGKPQPYMNVGDRKYRFRLLNASNIRSYDFALEGGMAMTQIATEGGLLPVPVPRTHIRLAPAERVEVVIDFAGKLDQNIVLRNLLGVGPTSTLMQFRVNQDVEETSTVPPALRPLPELEESPASLTRTWVLSAEVEPLVWTINGRPYDPHRVDTAPLNPTLGSTERWVFVNATTAEHVVHIHDVDWRLTQRIGPTPLEEDAAAVERTSLKETFLIRPGEVIEVVSTFTDHVGQYVLHCHLLEHEDRAMMANFEVVEPIV